MLIASRRPEKEYEVFAAGIPLVMKVVMEVATLLSFLREEEIVLAAAPLLLLRGP